MALTWPTQWQKSHSYFWSIGGIQPLKKRCIILTRKVKMIHLFLKAEYHQYSVIMNKKSYVKNMFETNYLVNCCTVGLDLLPWFD